jgi:osmotically-inducible protein OsmY
MSSELLRQRILDELDFDPSIEASALGVAVTDGVVTLTGHVSSYAEKLAAEHAAWRVKGVRAVVQDIEVRFGRKVPGDESIALQAVERLAWDATLPADSIRVTVHGGWITLEGKVNWQFQRESAESALKNLHGIVGITNNITLLPRPQAPMVKQRIEEALRRRAREEANGIRVRSDSAGGVVLEGTVDSWFERAAAEHAAWSVAGVTSVTDHIRIA